MDYPIDGCRMPSCNSTLIRPSPNFYSKRLWLICYELCMLGWIHPIQTSNQSAVMEPTTSLRWPRWPPRRLPHIWGISWKGWGILVVIWWDLENQEITQFWVGEIESTTSDWNPLVPGGGVFDGKQVTIICVFWFQPSICRWQCHMSHTVISFSINLMASFNHKVSMRIRYDLTVFMIH